jgi:hypothetical protein
VKESANVNMTADLSEALSFLADVGTRCLLVFGAWSLGGILLFTFLGAVIGLLCARPLLRWSFGQIRPMEWIAVALVASCGAVGGLWAGMWAGAAHCVDYAVQDRFVLEDLAVQGLFSAVAGGIPSDDPAENAAKLRSALDEAGGSIVELLNEIQLEIEIEGSDVDLPEFLSPEIVPDLITKLEEHELFEPELLAEIAANGGFFQSIFEQQGEHSDYAERIVDITRPVRRDMTTAVVVMAATNALVSAPIAIMTPMLLLGVLAGIGRLLRRPKPPQAVV